MISLTEPQVWTLIGVLGTLFFATLGAMSGLVVRVVRTEISGLRGEMGARFEAVDARFEAVDARFEAVNVKLEHLDRDVQALTRHVFRNDG